MSQEQKILDRFEQYKKIAQIGPTTLPRMLPAMPIEVPIVAFSIAFTYERDGNDVVFRAVDPWEGVNRDRRKLDAYAIRDLFLRIRTPEEALDFLTATGFFHSEYDVPVSWSEFKLWQELIRLRMTTPYFVNVPEAIEQVEWDSLFPHFEPILKNLTDAEERRLRGIWDAYYIEPQPSKSDRRQMELIAHIDGNSTLEAMLAVVNIDHLQGINYRLCNLSGCNNIFKVTRPDKVFCGHPCAHKALVYKKRKRLREAKQAVQAAAQPSE